jgi:hypothetical protein
MKFNVCVPVLGETVVDVHQIGKWMPGKALDDAKMPVLQVLMLMQPVRWIRGSPVKSKA